MTTKLDELPVPPSAVESDDAGEVLRAWIVDEQLAVSMVPAFEEPEMWGMLAVDIARHAARMFADEGICSEAEALARIRALIEAEFARPTDPGATVPHPKPQGH